jgi:hypothetical protein
LVTGSSCDLGAVEYLEPFRSQQTRSLSVRIGGNQFFVLGHGIENIYHGVEEHTFDTVVLIPVVKGSREHLDEAWLDCVFHVHHR